MFIVSKLENYFKTYRTENIKHQALGHLHRPWFIRHWCKHQIFNWNSISFGFQETSVYIKINSADLRCTACLHAPRKCHWLHWAQWGHTSVLIHQWKNRAVGELNYQVLASWWSLAADQITRYWTVTEGCYSDYQLLAQQNCTGQQTHPSPRQLPPWWACTITSDNSYRTAQGFISQLHLFSIPPSSSVYSLKAWHSHHSFVLFYSLV